MLLLAFTVRNHKSIRDELVLDLTKPTLQTLQPTKGTRWNDHVYPLAGIFGGNATGKSAILDAFSYAFAAIRQSATSWQAAKMMPRAAFLLDDHSSSEPSSYEFDFVHGDRRYVYGFEVDDSGIRKEVLRDIPSTRWRTLIDRDRITGRMKLHPELRSVGAITPRELILSRSILLEHPQLSEIATALVDTFDASSVKDTHRERRLASITESLANGSLNFDDIVTLLQAADIGVEKVEIREDTLPPYVQKFVHSLKELIEKSAQDNDEEQVDAPTVSQKITFGIEESDAVVRNLLFTHHGTGKNKNDHPFLIDAESDGTIAWLALIVPALEILRCGGLHCVDEIDSSLHPHLLELLLTIFNDPQLNTKGAQLIFTSHESYILSPLSDIHLEPEQVWFTDKSIEGVTELSSLADFPRHKDANVAKRYLMGRYGGTPLLMPSAISRLLLSQIG